MTERARAWDNARSRGPPLNHAYRTHRRLQKYRKRKPWSKTSSSKKGVGNFRRENSLERPRKGMTPKRRWSASNGRRKKGFFKNHKEQCPREKKKKPLTGGGTSLRHFIRSRKSLFRRRHPLPLRKISEREVITDKRCPEKSVCYQSGVISGKLIWGFLHRKG